MGNRGMAEPSAIGNGNRQSAMEIGDRQWKSAIGRMAIGHRVIEQWRHGVNA